MHDGTPSLLPLFDIGDTGAIMLPQQAPLRFRAALRPPPRPRGHAPKITAAFEALGAVGQLPDLLRQCEIIDRCDAWLERQGCKAHERPSRSSYVRFFRKRSK